MRTSVQTKLRAALDAYRVPLDTQQGILNAVFNRASTENATTKAVSAFDLLLCEVRAARRAVMGNKGKADVAFLPLYEEYVSMTDRAVADIDAAKHMLLKNPEDPDGARVPATLTRITAIAAKRAAHAEANGLPPTPTCTASWPSWIDPAERKRIVEAFDARYTALNKGSGRRFIPFSTVELTRSMDRAIAKHHKFIAHQRAVLGEGTTHYIALHLCALRMAELWLERYVGDVKKRRKNPGIDPIPVNWMHLLTRDMRARVRAADADPSAPIDATGLHSFLNLG
jgi:hypothetical protein